MDKFLKRIVWLFIVAPFGYLAVVWNKLPQTIATHFDIHGKADKYNSKKEFLLFMAIMLLASIAFYLILTNIYRIDPKKYAAENKGRLQKIAFTVVIFLAALQSLIIYTGLQRGIMHKLDLRFLFALMGVFFAVLGNYMNNLKPNYFAGFRLPWTLENPDNWRYTHHLVSKLWFGGGLLITIVALCTSTTIAMIGFFIVVAAVTIIPIIYSYRFYKKQKLQSPAHSE